MGDFSMTEKGLKNELNYNLELIDKKLRADESFDIIRRDIVICKKRARI